MQWQVGNVRVTRIEEMCGPMFDPVRFFPDYTPETFQRYAVVLYPDHVADERDFLINSMHSWLIETPHHKILIDTCIGDHKPRMPYRDWHDMRTPWMTNLTGTGVKPEDIDFVMCTHLHVDHVGWNTRLDNGQWVPTFPNAKYLFSKTEFEHWQEERNHPEPDTFHEINNQTFDDSVLPIMHLAELVEGEVEVLADLLKIIPAPGHTPGSINIELSANGESALFTGDVCHHPIQVLEPSWNSAYCVLPEQARTTRVETLQTCYDHNVLMMPAHFAGTHAGHVRASDNNFEFEFT